MKLLAMEADVPGASWSGAETLLKEEARRACEAYLSGVPREICVTEAHKAVMFRTRKQG
jgi:hypothetical protein